MLPTHTVPFQCNVTQETGGVPVSHNVHVTCYICLAINTVASARGGLTCLEVPYSKILLVSLQCLLVKLKDLSDISLNSVTKDYLVFYICIVKSLM